MSSLGFGVWLPYLAQCQESVPLRGCSLALYSVRHASGISQGDERSFKSETPKPASILIVMCMNDHSHTLPFLLRFSDGKAPTPEHSQNTSLKT